MKRLLAITLVLLTGSIVNAEEIPLNKAWGYNLPSTQDIAGIPFPEKPQGAGRVLAAADVKKLMDQSEPPIQAQIQTVSNTLQSRADPQSNVEAFREIQTLKDSVDDKGEIVKQVAIFAAKPGEQQPLASLAILDLLDLPPSIVIRVLAPYLDAENANLRSFVRDWFQDHDNAGSDLSPLEQVNFEDYKSYIRGLLNTRQEIPPAFVEYIYERSPDRALLVFYYATRKQGGQEPDILFAEHLVSNAVWLKENDFAERFQMAVPEATAELEKLAQHKEWWARLYVAEIMRRHRELRQPEVLQRLSTDTNAHVSKTAKSAGR